VGQIDDDLEKKAGMISSEKVSSVDHHELELNQQLFWKERSNSSLRIPTYALDAAKRLEIRQMIKSRKASWYNLISSEVALRFASAP
jgi:hypothetical protein